MADRPTPHVEAVARAFRHYDRRQKALSAVIVIVVTEAVLLAVGPRYRTAFVAYLIGALAALVVGYVLLPGAPYLWARLTYHGRQALTEIDHLRADISALAPNAVLNLPVRLPPELAAIAADLRTAELLSARFPPPPSNAFMVKRATPPDDLLRDVTKWRDAVMTHLEPWPDYQGHFGAMVQYHGDPWNPDTRVKNDLRVRVGVLERVYDQLVEEEKRRQGR